MMVIQLALIHQWYGAAKTQMISPGHIRYHTLGQVGMITMLVTGFTMIVKPMKL